MDRDLDNGLAVDDLVLHPPSRRKGVVEYVGDEESMYEVLVDFVEQEADYDPYTPFFSNWEGKQTLEWVKLKELQPITRGMHGAAGKPVRSKKRREVQDYEDRLRAIQMQRKGLGKAHVSRLIGRSENFVKRWWNKEPATLHKPSGLEYMDMRGYRELKYVRRFTQGQRKSRKARKASASNSANSATISLYEKVLGSYQWEQATSTSKREKIGSTALGGGASYFHRAKRLCKCGRELQKV
jgi:hypothetical protein